jgi:predicted nucleic-acid-binding Zn-ribbon protein
MRCSTCTDELPVDALFCPSCGTRLAPPISAPALAFQRTLSEGICPKCGSTEIYVDDRGLVDATGGISVLNLHDIWHGSKAAINTYLCAACGYLEFFLAETDRLPEIIQTWRRIG